MTDLRLAVLGTIAGLAIAGSAFADDTGKGEFMNACATCHGENADGNGPLAELMTVPVPSLTGLSAENDGKFPMLDVIHAIDGRQGTRGHGYPMPVWGKRFHSEIGHADTFGAESIVRGRILSIAYYLESIQN